MSFITTYTIVTKEKGFVEYKGTLYGLTLLIDSKHEKSIKASVISAALAYKKIYGLDQDIPSVITMEELDGIEKPVLYHTKLNITYKLVGSIDKDGVCIFDKCYTLAMV